MRNMPIWAKSKLSKPRFIKIKELPQIKASKINMAQARAGFIFGVFTPQMYLFVGAADPAIFAK